MGWTVAIDPGLRHCGCAIFVTGGQLHSAFLIVNPFKAKAVPLAAAAMAAQVAREAVVADEGEYVFEWPRIYGGGRGKKGDPNDIVALGSMVIASTVLLSPHARGFTYYEPSQWKGQVPKNVMGKRILSKLSESEKRCIQDAGANTHNIIDAVGIGLKFLGRLK